MPRKATGKPPGRPRKDDAAEAAAAEADRTGAPLGEAAKRKGVSRSTAFAAKARSRASKGSPARPKVRPPTSASPAAAAPVAGVLTSSPLDRLRAYAAHDAEALAALERLLLPPEEGLGRDELQALRDGLVLAAKLVREAAESRAGGEEADDGRLLRALQRLEGLGKTVANVKAKRPHEDGPDEVTKRIVAARAPALDRIGLLTSETAVRFQAKRAELDAWCGTLGEVGAMLKGKVDAMLGGPAI